MSYRNQQKKLARRLLVVMLAIVLPASVLAGTSYPDTWSRDDVAKQIMVALPLTEAQTPPSRANGRIAFVSTSGEFIYNADIYTMNPDGSDRRRLTLDPRDDIEPAWSPDGTKIAFVRSGIPFNPHLSTEIYVMNADGSDQRQLTELREDSYYHHPTWSPDGTKIAFLKAVNNSSRGVIVMNADGSDQRTICQGDFHHPAWSPDGLKIADSRDGVLVLINIDGSKVTQITQLTPHDPATRSLDYEPAWSPDGSKIVFTRLIGCDWDDCSSSHLYVVNSDGSNPTDLTRQDNLGDRGWSVDGRNAWSPDGRKIVFGGSDLYVINPDGSGLTNLTNTNDRSEDSPSWQPLSSIDGAEMFVRQHYLDFLNREPDASGLQFWTNEISSCGADAQCIENKRINVSAAFFLSIEFQQTGYLVYRMYKAAYGDMPGTPVPLTRQEFLPDTQRIGQGVVVGAPGWEQELENNKNAFVSEFVARSRFTTAFPQGMTSEQFVDALNANAGGALSPGERDQLVSELTSGAKTRAQVLRSLAEDAGLARNEFNKAFVLMQYFGYLRRNPNDPPDADFSGYNFWLNKLNSFGGNFVQAEMVKAFINSAEYRQRFDSCLGCWDY